MILASCDRGHDVRLTTRLRGHDHQTYCAACEPRREASPRPRVRVERLVEKRVRRHESISPIGFNGRVYPL